MGELHGRRQAAVQDFFSSDGFGVGVVSGVIRATESESEQSKHFHFFRLRLRLRRLRSAYNLVKTRMWKWEAEVEGLTNYNSRSHAL